MTKEIRLVVEDEFDADEFVQALLAGGDHVVWVRSYSYDKLGDTIERYSLYEWVYDGVISGEVRETRRTYGKDR